MKRHARRRSELPVPPARRPYKTNRRERAKEKHERKRRELVQIGTPARSRQTRRDMAMVLTGQTGR